jgi:hypothetical protein
VLLDISNLQSYKSKEKSLYKRLHVDFFKYSINSFVDIIESRRGRKIQLKIVSYV